MPDNDVIIFNLAWNHVDKHIFCLMKFLTKIYTFKRLKMIILIWGPLVHGDQMWWGPLVHGDQLSWGPIVFRDQMDWDHLSIGTKWLWGPSESGTKCVTAKKSPSLLYSCLLFYWSKLCYACKKTFARYKMSW